MSVRLTQLQCKEVICVSDGMRLGFISDVVVEVPEGKLCAIVVPGPGKLFGVLGHHEDYLIPWDCIRRVGPDIVLVDVKPEECRSCRPKRSWLMGG